MSSPHGLKVTVPYEFKPADLFSEDGLPENDHAVWDAGTTYALGDRCIKDSVIWESAQAGNLNHDPAADLTNVWWLRVSRTNRWKMFELDQTVETVGDTTMEIMVAMDRAFSSVHVFGMKDVDEVWIWLTDENGTDPPTYYKLDAGVVGFQPKAADWWEYCFGDWQQIGEAHWEDLPMIPGGVFGIGFYNSSGPMSVQTVLVGTTYTFGDGVTYGLGAGYQSYSKVTRDQWGTATLRKGNRAKTLNFSLMVPWAEVDDFNDFMNEADGRVMHWSASNLWRTTQLIGFVTDYRPTFRNYGSVEINIRLEGMATK